jgi:DNA invertase Pin-like site-specific DNA recombinase
VFREKASGAKSDRAELHKLIQRLDAGDVLMVTRLDRLARSTRDLLNVLNELGKRGVGFKSLKDAWADATTPHGKLMLTARSRPSPVRATISVRSNSARPPSKRFAVM